MLNLFFIERTYKKEKKKMENCAYLNIAQIARIFTKAQIGLMKREWKVAMRNTNTAVKLR